MAVDDIVRTTRDIRTFDPKTLKILEDGIPRGSLGTVVLQDDENRFISVEFEFIREGLEAITKIVGIFGEDIVDTITNSLEFITVEPAPELLAEIRESSTVALESRDDLALQREAPESAQDVEQSLSRAEEEFSIQFERTKALEDALARIRDLGFEIPEERLQELEQLVNQASDIGEELGDRVLRRFSPESQAFIAPVVSDFTAENIFDDES